MRLKSTLLMIFSTFLLFQTLAFAKPFSEVLDDIYAGREEMSVDLSQADPDFHYFFYHYIQYRDNESDEWQDWKGRKEEFTLLSPQLVGVDLYWGNHIAREDNVPLVVLESYYSCDFKVIGTDLTWHLVLMEESWDKGNIPYPMDMNVTWHQEVTFKSHQRSEIKRKIGNREYKIYFGFITQKK